MNDDIIAMARAAGIKSGDIYKLTVGHMSIETLKRFADLVRAADRNKLAAWMMAQGYATGHGETIEGLLEELEREASFDKAELWLKRINEAVLAERDACAKLAWTTPEPNDEYVPLRMAIHDAIRARGQA